MILRRKTPYFWWHQHLHWVLSGVRNVLCRKKTNTPPAWMCRGWNTSNNGTIIMIEWFASQITYSQSNSSSPTTIFLLMLDAPRDQISINYYNYLRLIPVLNSSSVVAWKNGWWSKAEVVSSSCDVCANQACAHLACAPKLFFWFTREEVIQQNFIHSWKLRFCFRPIPSLSTSLVQTSAPPQSRSTTTHLAGAIAIC